MASELARELISKTYRPDPVWRLRIAKPGGGERLLGIPTIQDRLVQIATNSCWNQSLRQTSRTMPMATVPLVGQLTRSSKCPGTSAEVTSTW